MTGSLPSEVMDDARIQLRALSVRQPWSSAIISGTKNVENRSKYTGYRGLVAIHAAKAVDWDAPAMAWQAAGLRPWRAGYDRAAWSEQLPPLGAIIGTAIITDCHPHPLCTPPAMCHPWGAWGQCHWMLEHARSLARPVECRGWLGIWVVPPGVAEAVLSQLEEAR